MYDKIIIIGNGFDLAHGLPTSYSDFLLWYANQTINEHNNKWLTNTNNGNVRIVANGRQIPPVANLHQFSNIDGIGFDNKLLKSILTYSSINNWVDIEYTYYSELIKIYKRFEAKNIERDFALERDIQNLNKNLEHIKDKLAEYLNQLDYTNISAIKDIIDKFKPHSSNESGDKTIFIIFNYTKTFDLLYKKHILRSNDVVLYIHGELNSTSNPIIFGYGDETDLYYEKIERLNINDFIRNFKSFKYSHSNNYKLLFNSIIHPHTVSIIGHSCGISDRLLLKEIFTSDLCRVINVYHYKRPDGTTDFEDKTFEISRHFSADLKHSMRKKVINQGPLVG